MNDLTNEEVILAGLGGRGRRSKKKSFGSETGASKNRRQFLDRAHKLPISVQDNLLKGNAQISDSPYYATTEIRSTRAELITISQSEELGITNIDNGKLSKGRH